MKVFHLFPYEKFTKNYIQKINKLFIEKEHLFYVYGKKQSKFPKLEYKNVILSSHYKSKKEFYLFILRQFMHADKIILHSLFLDNDLLKLITIMQFIYKEKFCWWIWGGDLYDKYRYAQKLNKYSKYYIEEEFFRKILIKNLKYISSTNKEDYDLVKEWYHTNAKFYYAFYPIELPILLNQVENHHDIVIILGNSATEENQHIEAINKLKFLANENIKIICPLSYPNNKKYIKFIQNYGRNIFHDKFITITNFMPYEKYMELLSSVDIAIFNNNRQQANGNIAGLLYLGKKVFINEQNPFLNYWKNKGAEIFKFNNFYENNFTKLLTEEVRERNRYLVEETLSDEKFKKTWEKVFNTKS